MNNDKFLVLNMTRWNKYMNMFLRQRHVANRWIFIFNRSTCKRQFLSLSLSLFLSLEFNWETKRIINVAESEHVECSSRLPNVLLLLVQWYNQKNMFSLASYVSLFKRRRKKKRERENERNVLFLFFATMLICERKENLAVLSERRQANKDEKRIVHIDWSIGERNQCVHLYISIYIYIYIYIKINCSLFRSQILSNKKSYQSIFNILRTRRSPNIMYVLTQIERQIDPGRSRRSTRFARFHWGRICLFRPHMSIDIFDDSYLHIASSCWTFVRQ
jgi:energy-coupling factor transporter transmembrane protein EcfT